MASPRASTAPETQKGLRPGEVVGMVVDSAAAANQGLAPTPQWDLRVDFECVRTPRQPFSIYMKRFAKFRRTDDLWVMALCLVHKLQITKDLHVRPHNVHRLLACALVVAIKLCFDCNTVNSLVAGFGGMQTADLSEMESSFLALAGWEINVWCEEYDVIMDNLDEIEEHAAKLCCAPSSEQDSEDRQPAMLLPESVARKLAAARDDIRNRMSILSVMSTPQALISPQWSVGLCTPMPPTAANAHPRPSCGELNSRPSSTGRQSTDFVRSQRRMDEAVAHGRQVQALPTSVGRAGQPARSSARSVASLSS
eukprot:TRINITY_DN5127_c0_g1_i1.p1 TRINITY_DN5127_c0_g1~~TRINITY_DN5127_c0_g1_i1.p1  ORF type:complete len:310 (+),score=78.39 TRINITY_DN5127_c0_g1_i1:87-1016(+)